MSLFIDLEGLKDGVAGFLRRMAFAHELQVQVASLRIRPARSRGNVFILFGKLRCS